MQDQIELDPKEVRAASRVAKHYRDKTKREAKLARKAAGLRQPKRIKTIGGDWE